jgi:putative membrane protein
VTAGWAQHPGSAHGPGPGGGPGTSQGAGPSNALRILEERYARGEIDREEYLQRRADLENEA